MQQYFHVVHVYQSIILKNSEGYRSSCDCTQNSYFRSYIVTIACYTVLVLICTYSEFTQRGKMLRNAMSAHYRRTDYTPVDMYTRYIVTYHCNLSRVGQIIELYHFLTYHESGQILTFQMVPNHFASSGQIHRLFASHAKYSF